jgi:hypothetical protein
MKTTASWRGTTRGCFKDNMGKIVPASMLLEELQKANGPPLICANVNAETVCDNKSNLKTKFSVMVKNSGKHKRRFRQCNRRKAELYACWFSFQYMHLHVL